MNDTHILLITSFIRIMVTFAVLYGFNFPDYIKIILVMISDTFDHKIPKLLGFYKNKHISRTMKYQSVDKLTDTIVYAILYIYASNRLNTNASDVLLLLFIYRLIGVTQFIKSKNSNYLYHYPNFYLEILLVLFLCQRFDILNKNKLVLIMIVIIYKILQECAMHYNKQYK